MKNTDWPEYHVIIRKKSTGEVILRKHVISAVRKTRAQLRIEAWETVKEQLALDRDEITVEVQG